MKKQRLEKFNHMVEQHQQHARDLCEMAGMDELKCDGFFIPPVKEPPPPTNKQPQPNGGWLKRLWPF